MRVIGKHTSDIRGAKGEKGSLGPQGSSGTNGTNGANGEDGADGNSHLSSYTFSVKRGNTLTITSGGISWTLNPDR